MQTFKKQQLIGVSAIVLSLVFVLVAVAATPQPDAFVPYVGSDAATLSMNQPRAGVPLTMGDVGSITSITVRQYTGGVWVIRGSITSSGGSVTVQPNQNTKFTARVVLDDSLAGSESAAYTVTREYITIAGESITNVEMTGETVVYHGFGFWHIESSYSWTTAGKPVAGTTYTITIQYQAYY